MEHFCKKILIANRGEIAVRIIRACQELGIKTVSIFSEVDRESRHVELADEVYCVGPAPSIDSYLNIPNIISVAELSGADAIHPGYGFLSENVNFAEICERCNIKFIGPNSLSISSMGDKAKAREIMIKNKIPVVPGTGMIKDTSNLSKILKKIGYPVIIKAALGGGGKGMRVVYNEKDIENAINQAKMEARASFGNEGVYIEKYIEEPRHIEFQIIADNYGNYVYLPERDCSIQRRHQKLIEESPSSIMTEKLRKKMGQTAVKVAKAIKYSTVGTVEFLLDKDEKFYFMEMNTRIQVEHPVSELVSGIDLIKEQILLALGKKLDIKQDDIKINCHAMECRINAEDSNNNFLPNSGKIENIIFPGGFGVRVDSHVYSGYTVQPFYDSMLLKLLTFSKNRIETIKIMQRCLKELKIEGIKTTKEFHQRVMNNDNFKKGNITTNFIEKEFSE